MSIPTWGRGGLKMGQNVCPKPCAPREEESRIECSYIVGETHLYLFGYLLHQGNGSHFRSLWLSLFQDFNPVDRF